MFDELQEIIERHMKNYSPRSHHKEDFDNMGKKNKKDKWKGNTTTTYIVSNISPQKALYVDGQGSIWGASGTGLSYDDICKFDIFVPLATTAYEKLEPFIHDNKYYIYKGTIMPWPMKDFSKWPDQLVKERAQKLVDLMYEGKKILIACNAGKGRTGLLLGACAIICGVEGMEKDPKATLRSFYHDDAIETAEQENVLRRMVKLEPVKETKYVYTNSSYNTSDVTRVMKFPGTSRNDKKSGEWVREINGFVIPESELIEALNASKEDYKKALDMVMEKRKTPQDPSNYLNPDDRTDPFTK